MEDCLLISLAWWVSRHFLRLKVIVLIVASAIIFMSMRGALLLLLALPLSNLIQQTICFLPIEGLLFGTSSTIMVRGQGQVMFGFTDMIDVIVLVHRGKLYFCCWGGFDLMSFPSLQTETERQS
jgi:hypothetical protein